MAAVDAELPRDPSAARLARGHIRRELAGALPAPDLRALELVVTELVANALEHGRGTIRLRLRASGRHVAGEVIDDGGGFEHEVRRVGIDELRGRGLLLVDSMTTRWGIHEGTTHVWFEIDAGDAGPPSAGPDLGTSRRPPFPG
jgi:anti-sigma regulatory factor (Ser/Thr protein kinase)